MSDSLKKIGNLLSNTAPECELQSVLACFNDARWELENNFSLGNFFIFQQAATKIEMLDPRAAKATCFYESSKRAPAMLNADLKSRASSQWGQDLWVLEKTAYKRQGFFVEFGASDGVRLSNTYLLEKEFEWKGLCAEPNPEFFAKLAKNRSCVVSPDCISGQSGQVLRFLLADEYGGIVDFCNDMHDTKRQAYHELGKEITLRTLSLHDFLSKHSAPHTIDYLSLDTEGSEYEILSHFPFEKWDVRIISVEHNFAPIRDKIYTLLASIGYLRQELMADDLYYLPSNP
jgi:FkbM family methyltransferase